MDLLLLSLFKMCNAGASRAQCDTFLQAIGGGHYNPQQISHAVTAKLGDGGLGMSMKRVEVVAREQDPVRLLQWRQQPPPVGHQGVPADSLDDIDECGLYLASSHNKYGHAMVGKPATIRAIKNKGIKYTLIAGIAKDGTRYLRLRPMVGTSAVAFYDFMTQDYLPFCGPGRFCMWDNLSSHTSPIILMAVRQAQCRSLNRPTYAPEVAPIEYFFGELKKGLGRIAHTITAANFQAKILAVAQGVTNQAITNTFNHCLY